MKEKVMALAQGKFIYEQPEIILSTEQLKFEVPEGGEGTCVFHVKNAWNTKMKGFCAVDEFDIEFLPMFEGKDNEITVKAHAGMRKAGDVMGGEIHIISDCGECVLPYQITVTGKYLEGTEGPVKSYGEFVRYAEEHFEEAVSFFYRDKFEEIYLREMDEKRLYQYLIKKNPKRQALEEFLVAHGDKTPVSFVVNKKQLIFEVEDDDVSGEIKVVRDSWGMTGIRLTSDQPFLSLDRDVLHAEDFTDGSAKVSFRILAGNVSPGRHRCRIVLENAYQRIEVMIRVRGTKGAEQRKERLERKKLTARLVRGHIRYMLNSSYRESWLQFLEENKMMLFTIYRGSELQLEGYIGYIARSEERMDAFVSALDGMEQPKFGERADKVYRYLFSLYLKVKIKGSKEEREQVIAQIRNFYANGYRHWKLLVFLEDLGYYQENPVGFLEDLDALWEEGYASPYMHLYRVMLILQEPDRMKKLDGRTIGALQLALKHDLITSDLVMAVSFLAARKKQCTPALFKLLARCYDMFENKDTLQSICALLIRSERQESRYFKWFQLGVEHSLRMTELFEYYMYTMDKDRFDEALSSVISYFKYENHLRDSVKASFYASIVRNREEHSEYFLAYQEVIREFALSQIHSRRISEELAVLYEACLEREDVKGQIAKDLPYILFVHHVKCENPNMERVVVVHDEGGGETKYNLVNGEAWLHIGTPNYKLYFEDKDGFYHARTISYQLTKMLKLDLLAESCYENGSDHPLLLLNLFSAALERKETDAQDAIILHTMIRNDVPGLEYRSRALLALYEYYRSIGEESLLEEVIRQIHFEYVNREKRAGILQTMIQHRMNDEALDTLRKYRLTDCSKKLILLLITWKIEENEGHFEPYYMRLCDFLYRSGVSNGETLTYLTNYYMGNTEHLREIYRDAGKRGAAISDGATERLLGQALFIADDPEKYAEWFLDYYQYGTNRVLAKAFLMYTSYEYLVGRSGLSGGVLKRVQKEGLSGDNHTMVLAMLKYYSGKEDYTESEREYIVYHLSQCVSTGKMFDFMRAFAGKLEVPFEVRNTEIVQFYSSRKGEVYIETEKDGIKEVHPMEQVFTDIYVYSLVLFRNERVTYRIYVGDMDTALEEGVLEREETPGGQDMAFFELVNGMIDARERGDKQMFDIFVSEYKCQHQMAQQLFTPLG